MCTPAVPSRSHAVGALVGCALLLEGVVLAGVVPPRLFEEEEGQGQRAYEAVEAEEDEEEEDCSSCNEDDGATAARD